MASQFILKVGCTSFPITIGETPLQMAARFCAQFHIDIANMPNVQNRLISILEAAAVTNPPLRVAYSTYFKGDAAHASKENYTLVDITGFKTFQKGIQF